jgi:8-oxo-dGTP pyrophosphatase MutT (NUDIX family)
MNKKKLIAAGILAIDKNTGDILLVKRSGLVPNPNKWATVGGKKDPEDENTRVTAIREFSEEVQPDGSYKLSKLPFFINETKNLKFYTYLGVFDNKFVPILNEENADYGWFNINDLPEDLLDACKFMFESRGEELLDFIKNKIK